MPWDPRIYVLHSEELIVNEFQECLDFGQAHFYCKLLHLNHLTIVKDRRMRRGGVQSEWGLRPASRSARAAKDA
jgi:hypothetical protein